MKALDEIPLLEIRSARERIAGIVPRTPLVRLNADDAGAEVYLEFENLQPIGSFKLRGAGNAMVKAGREALARGACTSSAGNMAQGVAWWAKRMGIACVVSGGNLDVAKLREILDGRVP